MEIGFDEDTGDILLDADTGEVRECCCPCGLPCYTCPDLFWEGNEPPPYLTVTISGVTVCPYIDCGGGLDCLNALDPNAAYVLEQDPDHNPLDPYPCYFALFTDTFSVRLFVNVDEVYVYYQDISGGGTWVAHVNSCSPDIIGQTAACRHYDGYGDCTGPCYTGGIATVTYGVCE